MHVSMFVCMYMYECAYIICMHPLNSAYMYVTCEEYSSRKYQ